MARWKYNVNLRDVFHADMPFPQKRDEIVRRIRASAWWRDCSDYDLEDVLVELEETQDAREFDAVWRDLYDVADDHRAWVATR